VAQLAARKLALGETVQLLPIAPMQFLAEDMLSKRMVVDPKLSFGRDVAKLAFKPKALYLF